LLLTDIIMPHMLGKEVAAAVTALRPGIRVVYMSGYAGDVLTSNGALDSRTLLLEKPFSEEDLARMVRHALERPEPGSR
jgi:FixJ family two-component response regulator